jgi:hypothetical protein
MEQRFRDLLEAGLKDGSYVIDHGVLRFKPKLVRGGQQDDHAELLREALRNGLGVARLDTLSPT